MLIWLLILSLDPIAIIDSQPTDQFLEPDMVTSSREGELFVLTKEQQILHFDSDYRLTHSFASKGQGPGQLQLASDLLWIEETQELWVNDFLQRRIAVFNREGQFQRNIKLNGTGRTFLKLENSILLCPQSNEGSFTEIDHQANIIRQFKSPFDFSSSNYKRNIWQMFQPEKLADGKIALGYIFANKISIIDLEGNIQNPMDMEYYYAEYPNPANLPLFMAQNTILKASNDELWVLTCDNNDQSCRQLLRINYNTGKLTGRSEADYNIRRIQRLESGNYAVIDRGNATVRIYDQFPFAVKGQSTGSSGIFSWNTAESPE